MRKFITGLVVIPLGVILVVFAVANRHLVTLSFDPFNSTDPSLALKLPLFVLIITAVVLGVVAGSCATWFRQRHWRRAARKHQAEARQAQERLADIRTGFADSRQDARSISRPVGVPPPGGGYGAIGRDKQGATL